MLTNLGSRWAVPNGFCSELLALRGSGLAVLFWAGHHFQSPMSQGPVKGQTPQVPAIRGRRGECPSGRGASGDSLLLSGLRKKGSIVSVMSSLGSNQILQSLRPREHLSAQWKGSKKISAGLPAGVCFPRKCELSPVRFWQAPHVSGGSLMPRAWGFLAAEGRAAEPAVGGQGGSRGWGVGELEAGRRGGSWWAVGRGPSHPDCHPLSSPRTACPTSSSGCCRATSEWRISGCPRMRSSSPGAEPATAARTVGSCRRYFSKWVLFSQVMIIFSPRSFPSPSMSPSGLHPTESL